MTTVKVEAQLTLDELVKAVEQLSLPELEQFVSQAIALQSQRKAPSLSKDEAKLFRQINQAVPAEVQQRYDELIEKRRLETLMPDEYNELLRLTDTVEVQQALAIEAMAQLAIIRQISLADLMAQLGIQAPH